MPNVSFESRHDTIIINFGNTPINGVSRSKWRKDSFMSVFQLGDNGMVVIRTISKQDYPFSFDGGVANTLPVDSVDGVSPSSNNHLFELLSSIVD